MSNPFHHLLQTCERAVARKRILSPVSFEYESYIQTNRVDELVRHTEFPNVRNHALCYAAAHSDVDAVKTFLAHGADFSTGDALYAAARAGNMPVVRFLVETVGLPVYEHHISATLEDEHVDIESYLITHSTLTCHQ
jgi:hypothetical protein